MEFDDYLTITLLYSQFVEWGKLNGSKNIVGKQEFGKRIESLFGSKKDVGPKNCRRKGWKNIKIKNQ